MSYRYKHRNFPCCMGGEDLTYCVAGEEFNDEGKGIGGGILEWCTSRGDAEYILAKMEKDPHFRNLKVEKWED